MDADRVALGFDGSHDDAALVVGRASEDGSVRLEATPDPVDLEPFLLALRHDIGQLCWATGTPRFLIPDDYTSAV